MVQSRIMPILLQRERVRTAWRTLPLFGVWAGGRAADGISGPAGVEAEPEAEAASAAVLELAERMKLPSLFKKYDADGDGVLSKAEVTAMMNAIGLKGEKRLLAKTLPHRMR